jgi:hypothetical protein
LESNPTRAILRDLIAGDLPPAAGIQELERRYRAMTPFGTDIEACMSAACRAHAAEVGTVLVITDADGKHVFGQAPDPGYDKNDRRMTETYRQLMTSVPAWHVDETADATRAAGNACSSVEYPIYVMPASKLRYADDDGPAVCRFGDYLISYDAPIAAN